MIFDKIENLSKYKNLITCYQEIISIDFKNPNLGSNKINDQVFYNAFQADLKNNQLAEAHYLNIDIHIPLAVPEVIKYSFEKFSQITKEYNNQEDAIIGKMPNNHQEIIVNPGEFVIFMPNEIHAPLITYESQPIKQTKIVVKIRN